MTDVFDPGKRSSIMSHVRGRDTAPERVVRSLLHKMGYRFRLHYPTLPGRPDIILPRHRKIILVHGCFWHGHSGCKRATKPKSNVEFWERKITGNVERDREAAEELQRLGWAVLTLWQCETRDKTALEQRLRIFLAVGAFDQEKTGGPHDRDKENAQRRGEDSDQGLLPEPYWRDSDSSAGC